MAGVKTPAIAAQCACEATLPTRLGHKIARRFMSDTKKNVFIMQDGFTMIELIVVIVILGILAATALPKFVSLKTDSAKAVADGLRGNLASAVNIAYAKCLATTGCSDAPVAKTFTMEGVSRRFYNGYPDGGDNLGTGIETWLSTSGVTIVYIPYSRTRFQVDNATNPGACYVDYIEATPAGSQPSIISVTTGC